jgi:hypothetical protein
VKFLLSHVKFAANAPAARAVNCYFGNIYDGIFVDDTDTIHGGRSHVSNRASGRSTTKGPRSMDVKSDDDAAFGFMLALSYLLRIAGSLTPHIDHETPNILQSFTNYSINSLNSTP